MLNRLIPSLLITATLAACATSGERGAPEVVNLGEYRQFLAELRQDLEQGDPPLLDESEMERYTRIEGRILTKIAGVEDVEEMNAREQTELLNLHESLWAKVRGRDDDQLVCRRVAQTGTNFRTTRCRTLGDIRASQRNAQVFLSNLSAAPEESD